MDDAPRRRRPSVAERREARALVEDPREVLDAAARFLEARPRSVAEVRRRLTSMGYRSALVDDAVTRMTELGYLDDEAFSRAWVASRDRARPRGEHALRRELQLKGVDRSIIDIVLEERRADAAMEVPAGEGGVVGADKLAAERLLRRKLAPILRESDLRRRRQRAYALLARSGFAPDVCSTVTKRLLDDPVASDDDDAGPDATALTHV